MRLIDADVLKAVFEEKSSKAVCGEGLCKAIIFRINEAPTVDAVPVIRCKNCKYLNDYVFPDGTLHLCEQPNKEASHVIDNLERFCSWAERKEK